ncbi:MAG: FxsA family protein [Candidatus Aquicultorales bacterium]
MRYHIHTMWFFIIIAGFILVPLTEIALFIQVGQAIGTLTTIAAILLLGLLGGGMVRWQGLRTLSTVKAELAAGRIPGDTLIEGLLVIVAGALLITPGFVTDIIGAFILFPPGRTLVRQALKRLFWRRVAKYQLVLKV